METENSSLHKFFYFTRHIDLCTLVAKEQNLPKSLNTIDWALNYMYSKQHL